jgi:hypothetical protein
MRRLLKRGLIALLVSLGLLLLVGWVFFRPLVRLAMTPGGSFARATPPSPPDYENPAHWSVLPGHQSAAFADLPGLFPPAPAAPAADVFYVHPTSYVGGSWNGPVDDAALNAATDRVATRIQASAFLGCCTVYAPRYRQANGTVFTRPSPDGDRALDVAYGDVARAFAVFQARRRAAGATSERPFFIAAHSQGSILAYRLLKEQISGHPAAKALVAAYLIGGLITRDAVARDLPDIPVCGAADQTGCLVGFNARGAAFVPNGFEMDTSGELGVDRAQLRARRVCVNPLSWQAGGAAVPAEQHIGAVFFDDKVPRVLPGFTGAECRDGALTVAPRAPVPRDFMSRLLDYALGAQNYHPVEYQMFFGPLRENASARLTAFLGRRALAPAVPSASAPAAPAAVAPTPR